jgi:septum formation protein
MTASMILASASPRRRELLDQIGVHYAVVPVDIDESMTADETPVEHVQRLAREKAQACASRHPLTLPVLGADTIVELNGEVMGKPEDPGHARRMLAKLSGKEHRVHTAVCMLQADHLEAAISSTSVEFDVLGERTIVAYIETGEPIGKAGAYAIQGRAAQFVKTIHGSYSSVVGLPLYETVRLLSAFGIRIL